MHSTEPSFGCCWFWEKDTTSSYAIGGVGRAKLIDSNKKVDKSVLKEDVASEFKEDLINKTFAKFKKTFKGKSEKQINCK